MNTVTKINDILKDANISKVNLAKYLGVSRQMVYNYLDCDNLTKIPIEKVTLLFKLLEVNSEEEVLKLEANSEYIKRISGKLLNDTKRNITSKKDEVIELNDLKKEEQELISDIVFLLKELITDDKSNKNFVAINYLYHFLQSMNNNNKEIRYILGYISKSIGFTDPTEYAFEEDHQFIFESIMYSAMTLYANGGASRSKLAESHKRWENELAKKTEEKLSRTQELNTAKVQALKELGYTEINEKNASEVFDRIAEIQARKI